MPANLFWLLSQFISVATGQPITLIKEVPVTQSSQLINCIEIHRMNCLPHATNTENYHAAVLSPPHRYN